MQSCWDLYLVDIVSLSALPAKHYNFDWIGWNKKRWALDSMFNIDINLILILRIWQMFCPDIMVCVTFRRKKTFTPSIRSFCDSNVKQKGFFLFHNCMWNQEYFFFQWLRNHITEKQRRKFWKLKLDFIKIAKIVKSPKSLAQSRNTNAFERQFPISITANRWAGCLWWKQCWTQPSSSQSSS